LGKLRLVSTQTKSWVENSPRSAGRMRIYVQDEVRMTEIINSKVNWSSVSIPPHFCNATCVPFLKRFNSSLIDIRIEHPKADEGIIRPFTNKGLILFLSHVSPCLKSLNVSEDLELWFVTAVLQVLGN